MDFQLFLTTFEQAFILIAFILIGYFFRKKNIITDGGRKVLAKLLVNLFAPAYSIISLSSVVNVQDIEKYLVMLLFGVLITFVAIFLGIPFSRALSKDKYHRNVFMYTFAFGNIGYFGYPLVDGIFGAEAKAMMILFCVPMCVAIYSYGYHVLTQTPEQANGLLKKEGKVSFIKKISFLYCPPMIGVYVGVALGLLSSGLGFEIPPFFKKLVTPAANCQSAPAMLITGAVLAGVPFGKLFTSFKPYLIGVIRLLVYPAIVGVIFFIIHLCGWSGDLFSRIAFLSILAVSMPVGMNTVVYPESVGIDSTEGAKNCFVSYIMALVTLPIVFSIAQNLLGVTF
ncbi:MAG: hypothetical protein E7340_00250 [Clostridiales bacterium]|nr:hypothetical protein [Clostridiales bacterium]